MKKGITVVLITHEGDIAQNAQRVVAFRDGRVVQDQVVTQRREAGRELAALPPLEAEA